MDYPLALSNGTILENEYRIEDILGSGGSGITYIATELPLDRKVAIKEYFPSEFAVRNGQYEVCAKTQADKEDYIWGLDRFIDEAQTLAKFDHTNIVRVFRYFKANNTAYMVLKFEEGQDFKTWFTNLGRPASQTELEVIITPLLNALELIHKDDFLHRDISPDNIIIRNNGSPVLIDFGSARKVIASRPKTVSALIKPGYSPYEQYSMTAKNQGPWTDIYSMAATLYHAVTNQRPSDSPSRMVDDELVPAVELADKRYRKSFLNAIDHALKLKIEERPKTVKLWREELFSVNSPVFENSERPKQPIEPKKKNKKAETKQVRTKKVEKAPTQEFSFQSNRYARKLRKGIIRFLAKYARPEKNQNLKQAESLIERLGDLPKKVDDKISLEKQLEKQQKKIKKENKKNAKALKNKKADEQEAKQEQSKAVISEPITEEVQETPKKVKQNKFVTLKLRKNDIKTIAGPTTQARSRIRKIQKPPQKERRKYFSKLSLTLFALQASLVIAIVSALVYFTNWQKTNQQEIKQNNQNLVSILNDHNGPVNVAKFSTNGDRIISVSNDKTLKLWNSFSGKLLKTLYGHYDNIVSLDLFRSYALTVDSSGKIIVWNLSSNSKVQTIDTKDNKIKSAYFMNSHTKLLVVHHNQIRSIDYSKKNKTRYIVESNDKILSSVYSKRRNLLATMNASGRMKLWRSRNGSLLRSYKMPSANFSNISFSSDSRTIFVATDQVVNIWSTRARKKIQTFQAHNAKIQNITLSPDGKYLATSAADNVIKVWNLRTKKLVRSFNAHKLFITHMSFSPDSRSLITSSTDRTIRLWNIINLV